MVTIDASRTTTFASAEARFGMKVFQARKKSWFPPRTDTQNTLPAGWHHGQVRDQGVSEEEVGDWQVAQLLHSQSGNKEVASEPQGLPVRFACPTADCMPLAQCCAL